MIGRGAIADPLLPLKIAKGNAETGNDLILSFLKNLFDEIDALRIPVKSKANKLKEYWGMMREGFAKDFTETDKPLYISSFGEVLDTILDIVRKQMS